MADAYQWLIATTLETYSVTSKKSMRGSMQIELEGLLVEEQIFNNWFLKDYCRINIPKRTDTLE